jgi:hypothetical protein
VGLAAERYREAALKRCLQRLWPWRYDREHRRHEIY